MMVGRHLLPFGLLAYIGCAEGKDIDVWRLPAGSGGVGGGAPSAGGGTGVGAGGSRTIGADAGGGAGNVGSGGATRDASSDSRVNAGGSSVATGGSIANGSDSSTPAAQDASRDQETTGFAVLYANLKPAASSPYVQCEVHVENMGDSSAAVAALSVRYYFTDEVRKGAQLTINWSHICLPGNCGAGVTVANTIAPLAPAAPGADTYIDFRFSSSQASIGPGETLDFAFQMQGPNPAVDVFLQNNDYSFDSGKTTPTAWGHVVLLQNGNVLWGSPP
jgi:hypothetical protein